MKGLKLETHKAVHLCVCSVDVCVLTCVYRHVHLCVCSVDMCICVSAVLTCVCVCSVDLPTPENGDSMGWR